MSEPHPTDTSEDALDTSAYSHAGRHDIHAAKPLDLGEQLANDLAGDLVLPEDATRVLGALAALLHEDTPAHLLGLARDLARAERIVARTESRALVLFEEALADGSGLELHPQTLRDAADAVRAARAAVQRAENELATFEREQAEADAAAAREEAAASAAVTHAAADDEGQAVPDWMDDDRKALRDRLITVGLGAGGLAFVLSAFSIVPIYVAIVPLVVAGVYIVRERRRADENADLEDTGAEEARAQLASIDAMTERLYGGRLPATAAAVQVATDRRRQLLGLDRDTAVERLRVAERTWHELAGPEADPADVEELLLRRDPQRHRAAPWVRESAAVRAAEALHERARSAWRTAWEALDREPPSAADADEAVRRLASDAAAEAQRRPVVVVAPPAEVEGAIEVLAPRMSVVVVHHDPALA